MTATGGLVGGTVAAGGAVGEPAVGERFAFDDLTTFAAEVLVAAGCPHDEAERVATCLVEADARRLASHGLLRLPLYVAAVDAGGIVAGAPMSWVRELGATAVLDAAYGFGHTAVDLAADRALVLAAQHGCAVVGVHRSTHFGMGAPWVERLADHGLVGILVSNTGPSVAPYGTSEPLLGTNPIAVGAPVAGESPLILDMATSAGAYGSIVSAAASDHPIPDDWALGPDGVSTTDPRAALEGVLRPFGGHKGSGLAMAIEILAAVLPGATPSHQITDMWVDPGSNMGTGHLLVGISPEALGDLGSFEARVRELGDRVHDARPSKGRGPALLPGELERRHAAQARHDGVALAVPTIDALGQLANDLGVRAPAPWIPQRSTPAQE